ncbi:MAG: cytochrome P450 [Anaerolineales bacterium]|jgi:cytochrome P450
MNSATLKSVPGPGLLEAVRGIRQSGFLAYIGQLWHTYGDTFQLRLGPRTLIFSIHPDSVRQINITNRQNYEKLKSYDTVRRYLIGEGLVASTGELWRRQRKLMSPFFTPRGVQAYAEIMLRDGMRLLERWEGLAQSGQTVEIGEEMTLVTASIILKAMFSTETDDAIVEMKDAVETMISFSNAQQEGIRPPVWLPTPMNHKYRAARDEVHGYINAVIAQRRALPEAQWPNDLLTRLMQARDEETGETMAESLLRDESITTFFAGHETTARTMSAAWYALASNPAVAAKLHEELDTVLGDRYPVMEDLHRLPYTLQVIKEVLRLYPPAPFYARDAVNADTLDGYTIPAGSAVMLSPYYTHRHPDFWEDPLRFDPDRWTPEREAARHPYAYHPFATGQRICIGNNFSLLESHILLALLAKHFAPRLAAGFTPQWVMQGVLSTANGLPMLIEAR